MNYFIKLNKDLTIELSNDLDTQERVELCNELIEQYPMYFKPWESGIAVNLKNVGNSAYRRLELLADYILDSTPNNDDYSLLTRYKEKRNKQTEVVFSDLENKYDKNGENY